MDTLFFLFPSAQNEVFLLQEPDNEFFEAYKRLDRLCSDMYSCRNGVSQYIEDMEHASYREQLAVPSWEQAYQTLKHLRRIRNQIAHDSGQVQICEECDIQNANAFYNNIIAGRDPLTQLHRYRKTHAAGEKAVCHAEPAGKPGGFNRSDTARPTRHRTDFPVAVLILSLLLAVIFYIIARYI